MALYRVFLIDTYNQLLPGNVWASVKTELNLLFDPIVGPLPYEGAVVLYSNNGAATGYAGGSLYSIRSDELLVYFMPPGLSVVAKAPHVRSANLTRESDGCTSIYDGASEVYVQNGCLAHPRLLAKLAFHECMHNKLQLGQMTPNGPDLLHASQDGLGAKEIAEDTPLTHRNRTTMTAALRRPVKQWTDGVGKLLLAMHDIQSPFHSPF
jgi:hypothetical protein